MRVSTAVVGILVGAGGTLGLAINRDPAPALHRRDPQSTTLYHCFEETNFSGINYFAFFEEGTKNEAICNPGTAEIAEPGFTKGETFNFMAYSVTCEFTVEESPPEGPYIPGTLVGHAQCPSMSNIEGRAGGPTLSLYCPVDEKTSVKLYCMPFVQLKWDGSLQ